MKTHNFKQLFKNKSSILSNFDDVCDFLSNDLPEEFFETYDIDTLILDIFGDYLEANEFDKVLKIVDILKQKFPEVYDEYFEIFDEFLVDYHCFHNNIIEAEKAFSKLVEFPFHDYHVFIKSFHNFLFYQHIDIVDNTISKAFRIVKKSDDYETGEAEELTNPKFLINLENLYLQTDNTLVYNREKFLKSLFPYDIKLKNDDIKAIEKGLFESNLQIEEITEKFLQKRNTTLLTFLCLFLKEMKNKNFHFAVSGFLFGNMTFFWEKQVDKTKTKISNFDDFFSINEKEFFKYLFNIASVVPIENQTKMAAILWGSVYIYDFLLAFNLISRKTYDNTFETIKKIKAKVIYEFPHNLWKCNFIHHWTKPDSISETEFREEEKIFKKSIFFNSNKFSKIKSEIAEELKNIGELSQYISKAKNDKKFKPLSLIDIMIDALKKNLKQHDDEENIFEEEENSLALPAIQEKKVGRNDPCPCGSGKKYKKCCG
jgi:hypothetical protein